MVLPFIKDGFECGQKALHIVNPKLRNNHRQRLASAGIDVLTAEQSGQFELRNWADAYLRDGRPATAERRLFLRLKAPFVGLSRSHSTSSVVKNALARARVDTPRKGAHQFRHALAVRMMEQGASLPEIGEVLRHRSPQATAIYARVGIDALRDLVVAWPGEAA